jgi:A/G-specific adenine glycosylase
MRTVSASKPASPSISRTLLRWYDRHRRDLPWRAAPGERAEPYRVWLSEVMLQQTTVKTVVPYYLKFLARWPDVRALADAPREDVLAAWAGLGYYARARNLHACARQVARDLGGVFPDTEDALRALPGIGAYTAAAIAAIAFGRRASPVDGNIERVMARHFAVATPLPDAKAELAALAKTLTPTRRAGDFAQALMDLGAKVCTPKSPDCPACPIRSSCRAKADNIDPTILPRRGAKTSKLKRYAVAFVILNKDLEILLRKRNEKGLLGGMTEVPSTPWTSTMWSDEAALAHAPVAASWKVIHKKLNHVFTHFDIDIKVMRAEIEKPIQLDGFWRARRDLHAEALPSIMRKITALAWAPNEERSKPRTGAGRR